ncbi:MAG: hypothetical protein HON90_00960 [Halobacteriovoraceae bacterium]|nr:hypothetical protein [Halobacteriovoraceae bacterium]
MDATKIQESNILEIASLDQKVILGINKVEKYAPQKTSLLRKSIILFLMLTMSNPLTLAVLGLLNRLLFNPISSVFVCYPATKKYQENYCFNFMLPFIKHYPVILGAFYQGGRIGLITAISSVESDFQSKDFFNKFSRWTNLLKKLLGVSSMTYSGILPSAMKKAEIMSKDELQERSRLVGDVVIDAEKEIRQRLNYAPNCPVIILGGKGNVGREVASKFLTYGRDIYIFDLGDQLPQELRNRQVILIDIARKGVLEKYIHEFWEGMAIVNETYPEPSRDVSRQLKEMNIPLFHVAGVKAVAIPKFPHAYAGGIPCCAMNPAKKVRALVRELN